MVKVKEDYKIIREYTKGHKIGDLSNITRNTKYLDKRYDNSISVNKMYIKEDLPNSIFAWLLILGIILGLSVMMYGGYLGEGIGLILKLCGSIFTMIPMVLILTVFLGGSGGFTTWVIFEDVRIYYKNIQEINKLKGARTNTLKALYAFNNIKLEFLQGLDETILLEETLSKLNGVVILGNGYRTYLYNVLGLSKGKIVLTTECQLVSDDLLVLEPKLTRESLGDYIKVLIEDNRYEIEYKKNKAYYDRLNESENKRLRELEEVKELVKKKEEVSDKLFKGNLDKKYGKYLEEASKSLLKSKELNDSKTKWESEEKL